MEKPGVFEPLEYTCLVFDMICAFYMWCFCLNTHDDWGLKRIIYFWKVFTVYGCYVQKSEALKKR